MKIRNQRKTDKIPLDMTPMIDIVFQLLAFFIMTFKVVANEGDFNVKMPLSAPSEGTPEENTVTQIQIQLQSDGAGQLAAIRMGTNALGTDFRLLRQQVRDMVGGGVPDAKAGEYEVEFQCDYNLHYENVIRAITAVTGFRQPDGSIVKLIEKVKFAPPKK